jgi:glycosyltransferase involved in cell wall biosynthesis
VRFNHDWPKMMKVIHVLNELKPSGAEVMLQNSFALWNAHGVNPEILSTGSAIGNYAATLAESGYHVHHLPYKRNPLYFLGYVRFLRRGGFDVIHQHIEGSGFWFGLAGLLAGCRVVRVSHNNFMFEGGLRRRRGFQRRLLARLGVTFVAVAEGVRCNERDRFGVDAKLILNWADVARFVPPTLQQRANARAGWGYAERDLVVVTLGNCSPVKNHSVLIEAIASDHRLASVKYLHVGEEDEAASERALAHRVGVADRVIFLGWVQDALPALHAADVYAMPSKFEGLGNATIEALAAGLPALLADVPGLRDFRPLFPGLMFCEPTPASVATRLAEFLALDPEERQAISSGYSLAARQAFSAARGVSEYVALYESAG